MERSKVKETKIQLVLYLSNNERYVVMSAKPPDNKKFYVILQAPGHPCLKDESFYYQT